jgi:hypothetical protein F3_00847
MEKLANRENITSLELLEQINMFREQEGKPKMKHKTLLDIIRKELYKEINEQKLLPISYTDTKNRKKPMYTLTFSQGKRVLLRESPTVRQAVIEYIDRLEKEVKKLLGITWEQRRQKEIWVRKEETKAIKALMEYGNIPEEKQKKYYIHYSKIPKMILNRNWQNRKELTSEELDLIQNIELVIYGNIIENILNRKPFSLIYHDTLEKSREYYRTITGTLIEEK